MRVITRSPARLIVIIPLIALILITFVTGITQARLNTYNDSPDPIIRINNESKNQTFTITPGDFAAGSLITDVNVIVTFYRSSGNVCVPGGPHANQLYIRLTSPGAGESTIILVPAGTYNPAGEVNQVTVTFDDDPTKPVVGGVPTSGTFRPVETLSGFNDRPPFGSWTLTIGDQNGNGSTCYVSASLEITAKATPTTIPDSYTVRSNQILTVPAPGMLGVLSNDSDPNGDPLYAALMSSPQHGTVTLNADGSFTYEPVHDYAGPDGFTYRASNWSYGSVDTPVSITVQGNNPPVANDDTYTAAEDTLLSIPPETGILANDVDQDQDPMTSILVSGPSHGTLKLAGVSGAFDYTPDKDFVGTDTFTYKANDGIIDSNIATVTITVEAVNHAPVAIDDAYTTSEDGTFVLAGGGIHLGAPPPCTGNAAVLGNDTDTEGDPLTAILVSGTTHGQFTLSCNGSISYIPDTDFFGTDIATYKANDGTADSNVATVTFTVTPLSDPPVGVADTYTTTEDTELVVIEAVGVLSNDDDPDGDPLTAILVGSPAHSTSFTLNNDGSFSYTPAMDYTGSDSFTYKANDGTGDSNEVTVTITVNAVNHAPVAAGDSYSVDKNGTLDEASPGVLSNDTDPDGNLLGAVLVSGPTHGTLTLNADGSFSYTPEADYTGSDSFTYKANDGNLDSAIATVSITVQPPINHAPVATDDSYSVNKAGTLDEDAPGVLGNDTDSDSDPLSAVLVSGPPHGASFTLNADGSFSYTPEADFSGSDTFTYKANDGELDSNVVTVTINVTVPNNAPQAVDDIYTTSQNVPLSIPAPGVLGNDTDPEGDSLMAALASGPAHGNVTLNADGSFTYTPSSDFAGTDNFTYTVNDGKEDSPAANVMITVSGGQTGGGGEESFSEIPGGLVITGQNTPGVIDGLGNNPDGESYTITGVGQARHGTLEWKDGQWIYTPDPGYTGEDTFSYDVVDSNGKHYRGYALVVVWKPVPTCRGFNGSDSGANIYATLNDGGVIGPVEVYCRTLVSNGIYERNGGEIGIQSVIDLGIIQAVEIFGLTSDGGSSYIGMGTSATVCLRGTGHLIFLDAAGMPRAPQWLDSWPANGFTCANLSSTGTLILVP